VQFSSADPQSDICELAVTGRTNGLSTSPADTQQVSTLQGLVKRSLSERGFPGHPGSRRSDQRRSRPRVGMTSQPMTSLPFRQTMFSALLRRNSLRAGDNVTLQILGEFQFMAFSWHPGIKLARRYLDRRETAISAISRLYPSEHKQMVQRGSFFIKTARERTSTGDAVASRHARPVAPPGSTIKSHDATVIVSAEWVPDIRRRSAIDAPAGTAVRARDVLRLSRPPYDVRDHP
jgi:hypothetical protein